MTKLNQHIEVISFGAAKAELLDLALKIRKIVFIIGQNVPEDLEKDGLENEATHYLMYVDNQAIGTARWRSTRHGIKLERFAVLDDYRNKGFGEIMLRKLLDDVMPLQKNIYLHAQADAVNFYLRNGFVISSESFTEAGIIHFQMNLPK